MYIKRITDTDFDNVTFYYKDPKYTILHREDGPAIEYTDGEKQWWLNGECHRKDGPAVEYADGTKHWYLNGKRHRKDGPAIERTNGTKEWWLNGKRHREDGPAIKWSNGNKSYYLNDKYFTKQEYIKNKIICPAKKSKIIKQCT